MKLCGEWSDELLFGKFKISGKAGGKVLFCVVAKSLLEYVFRVLFSSRWFELGVSVRSEIILWEKQIHLLSLFFFFPFFEKTWPVIDEFLLVYFVFFWRIYFVFPNHCSFFFIKGKLRVSSEMFFRENRKEGGCNNK